MNNATRSLLHYWNRECRPKDNAQRRRALLARNHCHRETQLLAALVAGKSKRLTVENTQLQRRNTELADKLKALHDRIPVYARIQKDERYFGRTIVIPISFNPDAVLRPLVFSIAEHNRSTVDLEREFYYLADFARQKILATLREAAAEFLGMSGGPR